jgi:NTP pyrophosphatase (non-canonical NTP hydrolase)
MPAADINSAYASFVRNLFVKRSHGDDGLMHAAVGIAGEAGELLDAIKKVWVYAKPLDRQNVIEELGDIEWYLQALRSQLAITRDECLAANVEKLKARYPAGYSDFHAAARLDKAA